MDLIWKTISKQVIDCCKKFSRVTDLILCTSTNTHDGELAYIAQ